MSELTNGRNQSKSFEYDSIGRIKSSTAPEGITEYTYDANGNVLTVKNAKGTITRTFDALNRVKTYTDSMGNTVKYEYDEVGNLTKLTYPDNTAVEYTYDLNNNLTKVTDWAGRETVYSYDKNNRLIETIKPNGIKQVNIYNEKQRLTSIKETKETSETETIISGYSYGYDLLGRVNFEKPLASIHAVCYTYDAVSRVISNGLVNTENSTISYREAFNYSPAGNIRTVYHNGAGTYEYDTQNKLTSFRDTSFTYDADGNMLTSTLGEFAFDSSNRLISTLTNSSLVTYTYDAEGTRIKSECGEDVITYTYDVNARLSKLLVKTEGNVTTKYVYGLGLIGEETDGEFKTYHFDLRGSTVAITNEACEVTDTFEYDTYGKVISRTGTSKTPFLYNGSYGVMTEASGLCYMRARYYSPVLKRFINADRIHGKITKSITLNRYAFCNGNPVGLIDPFGEDAILDEYITEKYSNTPTITLVVDTPNLFSRKVVTVDDGRLVNGHSFVRLDNGNGDVTYIGLAADDSYGISDMLFSRDVKGKVVDDSETKWDMAKVYELTMGQYDKANEFIDLLTVLPPSYNIETYNCTTLAVDIVKYATGSENEYVDILEHKWQMPRVDEISALLLNYNVYPSFFPKISESLIALMLSFLMNDNHGYTPADAAEDLKYADGDVLVNADGSIIPPIKSIFRQK